MSPFCLLSLITRSVVEPSLSQIDCMVMGAVNFWDRVFIGGFSIALQIQNAVCSLQCDSKKSPVAGF